MAAQVVTTQPGVTVAGQQSQVIRDWNSGLFACFDDMSSCLMGTFCSWCQLCDISKRMGEGSVYGCCCYEVAPLTLRAQLRTQQNIQGSLCNDAVVGMFCVQCVLCQMDRELKAIGK